MRHILSALVMNQPGVLAHISGMLASRAFNIDSLAVGATENPNLSRMTFVVKGDEKVLDQVRKRCSGGVRPMPDGHHRTYERFGDEARASSSEVPFTAWPAMLLRT